MRVKLNLAWVLVMSAVAAPGAARESRRAALAGYRDGAHDVSFERTGERYGGLQRLRLHYGEHTLSAWVGAEAVVRVRGDLTRTLARHGLHLVRPLSPKLGLYLVRGRAREDGVDLAVRLRHVSELQAVPDLHRERRRAFAVPPNDPRYGGQWYLDLLEIEDAWRLSSGSASTTIAIIDDGCDMTHPDLSAHFVGGIDPLDGDDDPSFVPNRQGNEHGTACAGIAAAIGDNGIGITGTCPECSLSCIRLVGGKEQPVPLSADIEAFEYAVRTGAAVISNSWGYLEAGPVSLPLAQQLARVTRDGFGGLGAVVVFAAGNENRMLQDDELMALPGVVAVGAINQFDEGAPFANHGNALDLSAPTGSLTTDIAGPDGASDGDYTNLFGGTSAACPVVAGVAGLMRSAAPQATASQIIDALVTSARRAPFAKAPHGQQDQVYGYGIVDPAAALQALLGTPTRVVDAGVETDDASVPMPSEPDPDAAVVTTRPPDSEPDDDGAVAAGSGDDAGVLPRDQDGGCSLRAREVPLPWWAPLGLLAFLGRLLQTRRRSVRARY